MREIEHRRHSWRAPDGTHLTQPGVALARRVGETMGKFDLVVTSDMPRALQTAVAMGYGVDREETLLGYGAPSWEDEVDWALGCSEFARGFALGGATSRACHAHADLLRRIASELPPNGRALIVSHGGIIEQGVVGLLPDYDYSTWGPSCERCEGALIRFDGAECVGAEILRLPPGWQ